ncbi:MAG: hypothetical protein J0H12_04615 [Candidatus Paracaedimonas acanthamoebae]|uniref:Uncharacterized protein n=1 Tax=Candidatus Paracaedimonas acanthamoebae TaxID=244581 RepID=A0A8J7PY77_9PROT|nr:hypothetical protein [Candidatus Paracaedimonas acanthamoebae]
MKYYLTKRITITSLLFISAVTFSFKGEAVTTFGQEEDAFSKLLAHPAEDSKSKGERSAKQEENSFKKADKTEALPLKKEPSEMVKREKLKPYFNKDLVGARLY